MCAERFGEASRQIVRDYGARFVVSVHPVSLHLGFLEEQGRSHGLDNAVSERQFHDSRPRSRC